MEVKTFIAQRNASKATGPNGVPTEILQLINNEVCEPLSKIYNLAVMLETHPEKRRFVNAIQYIKKVLEYCFPIICQSLCYRI